jgi:N-acetylneuraminic acid mutarotase
MTICSRVAIALTSLCISCAALADTAPNTWSPTGALPSPHDGHTLTLLASGQALAAGGCSDFFCNTPSRAAATYDAATGQWSPTGDLTTTRMSHAASLLAGGQVLVSGGCNVTTGCTGIASAELYDPGGRTWSATGVMTGPRRSHTSTRLLDGRVLVTGGVGTCNSQTCVTLASTELYDPQAGQWSPAAAMPVARMGHVAVLLADGRVLVVGGCVSTGLPCNALGAVLYDPVLNSWSSTGGMVVPRTQAQATLLPDGHVVVSGGFSSGGFAETTVESYDPASNSWAATGTLTQPRFGATASLLASGQILIAGGGTAAAEIYDPVSEHSTPTAPMTVSRSTFAALTLPTGDVLAAGGIDAADNVLDSSELYHPGAGPLVSLNTTSLDFGLVESGTVTAPMYVNVTNTGTALLLVGGVTLTGTAQHEYFATPLCQRGAVPPGASCPIAVRFLSIGLRDRNAMLSISDNAPDSPQLVALTGVGYAVAPNRWAPGGNMSGGRSDHTATLLYDGTVLVAGGSVAPSADTFDSAAGTWQATGAMTAVRHGHTETLLFDGRVLAAGGGNASAELYDPMTRAWSATGSMATARYDAAAARLPDGRVITSGGCAGNACPDAEIYDPALGTWSPAAAMHVARVGHTTTVLTDGRVLVAGGTAAAAELYDAETGLWTLTGSMHVTRTSHTATRLADGRVLVTGGCNGQPCRSAEIYDPATGLWTVAANMQRGHIRHAAVALADGRVLVSGGTYYCDSEFGFCFTTNEAEIYTPASNTWAKTGRLIAARERHTATLLPDGRALVTGGVSDTHLAPYYSTEIFTP